MAYIPYGQSTTGGKQVAEAMATLQDVGAKLQNLADWINGIGGTGLETNTDFSVASGQGTAFNDTFLQIQAAYAAFLGDGTGATNREKISRLARGE
jgi:hypothetical protein